MRSEASDAEWFGMEFVIAGRQVRLLTDMRAEVNNADFYDASVSMKLWAIREYIVATYRRHPVFQYNPPAFQNHVRR